MTQCDRNEKPLAPPPISWPLLNGPRTVHITDSISDNIIGRV